MNEKSFHRAFHLRVFGDVIVIATFGKALAFVHGVEGFRGEVACATGCGAVHHNQGDVSSWKKPAAGFC